MIAGLRSIGPYLRRRGFNSNARWRASVPMCVHSARAAPTLQPPQTAQTRCGRSSARRAASMSASAAPSSTARSFINSIPHAVLTDSYKACHPLMYPDATKMVAVSAASLSAAGGPALASLG